MNNWKIIEGFGNRYKVNEYGEIYSIISDKKLKSSFTKQGYKQYVLYDENHKAHIMFAHKAVALAFIPNPYNFPIINHKDENKQNNYYENLEWCDFSYNNSYNDLAKKKMANHCKKVFQYDKEGNLINEFYSLNEAARITGFSIGNIIMCVKRKPYGKKQK